MKKFKNHGSRINQVRLLLRENPDGLTVYQLADATGVDRTHLSRVLNKMPDAYIDRWVAFQEGQRWMRAVWCVVVPPDNCPRPVFKPKEKTK
jgi:predicted DNA-binding transcriptional regulator YafY